MNVISFEEQIAARLGKRAAGYGMDVVREPAGTWALWAWGFKTPELSGASLREIAADLDLHAEQPFEFDDDFIIG
jgi:hypothetical protein